MLAIFPHSATLDGGKSAGGSWGASCHTGWLGAVTLLAKALASPAVSASGFTGGVMALGFLLPLFFFACAPQLSQLMTT